MVEELEKSGVTCVPPPIPNQLGPGSLDLRVGKICTFKEMRGRVSLDSPPPLKEEKLGERGLVIAPNEVILITTMEEMIMPQSPEVVGWITNKSSWARKGLSVTTQFVNPGHVGRIELLFENFNNFPLTIHQGDRIAQMVLVSAGYNPSAWYESAVDPFKEDPFGPSFSTLTLGNEFSIFKGFDTYENTIVPEGEDFVLKPDQFVLGITRECVSLEAKDYVGMLVRTNAYFYDRVSVLEGLLNPGFKGKIVLEIKNRGHLPVRLSPGTEIYRVCYCQAFTFGSYLSSPGSKYVGAEKTSHPQL